MVSNLKLLAEICDLSTSYYRMAKRLLPGPYTLIFNSNRRTPQYKKSTPRKTVGVRIPNHSFLVEILRLWERPLITTSVTDAEEIGQDGYFEQFEDPDAWWTTATRISSKLGGVFTVGLETTYSIPLRVSTVIDCTQASPVIIRDGGWPVNESMNID